MAGATSVIQLSFEELVDHSESIVSGQVTRSWADWDSEHKFIWTHYEVAVSAVHKGAPGATVVVSELGGAVDGQAMTVAGTVTYQPGENVLIFLTRVPNGYLRTTGWGQGKYTVDGKGILHGRSVAAARNIDHFAGRDERRAGARASGGASREGHGNAPSVADLVGAGALSVRIRPAQ